MKKLLIIQQDEAYFLFETLQVLEKYTNALKDFDLTILVEEKAYRDVYDHSNPVINGLTWNKKLVQETSFDVSVNLSMNEESWDFHSLITSQNKIGPYRISGQTFVKDLWSSYLMTLKAKAPFLTFHLQDLYKNILGIKNFQFKPNEKTAIRQIAFAMTAVHLFSADEQELLVQEISRNYPNIPLIDISEIDLISDLSQTLFIGPASLNALKLCEAGGKGIFLSGNFQGFNLLPHGSEHLFVSSRDHKFKARELLKLIGTSMKSESTVESPYSIYRIEHENIFGAHLKSLNASDDNYPFYQAHVVLWNFLLNLFDVNLDIIKCSISQVTLLKTHQEVLRKLIRLHDYAMVSIDTIYHEAKSPKADGATIEGHLKNLREIDRISDQIAQSHSLLRPVLDFYRIRRGQNEGSTLAEQAQASFLAYSEEHQALEALLELFSVTLKQNEVSI